MFHNLKRISPIYRKEDTRGSAGSLKARFDLREDENSYSSYQQDLSHDPQSVSK